MNTRPVTSIIVLFTLISSGCLGIIEDINDDIDNKIDFIDGEYPKLNLSERIYGSPRSAILLPLVSRSNVFAYV